MGLIEAVIKLAGPRPISYDGADLPCDEFGELLNHAWMLLRSIPAERREQLLGPLYERYERRHSAAVAWCVSHFCDPSYREALAAARVPWQPADRPAHPLDYFTMVLGGYLEETLLHGWMASFRMHGWLGDKSIDFNRGWFVEGNMRFDALGNAVEMADGRRITGIEARLVPETAGEVLETTGKEEDEGEATGGEVDVPPEALLWMGRQEAKAILKDGAPRLQKEGSGGVVDECCATFGVTRRVARATFVKAVPQWRQRSRGGTQ
jgi:hypothetical protein